MQEWNKLNEQVSRDNTAEDVKKIVRIVKPNWNNVHFKHLEGGKANQTITCHNGDDVTKDDVIIVRVRHNVKEEALFNFKNEIPVIKKASEAGLCGKILATFRNGIVLEYLPGRALNWVDVDNPKIIRLFAELLADFHCLQWQAGDLPDAPTLADLETVSKEPTLFQRIHITIDAIPCHPTNVALQEMLGSDLWSKEDLSNEVDFLSGFIEKLNLPIVLAHNDVQVKNTVYDEKGEKLYLIDYECTSFNYEGFDIANMFNETGMKTLGIIPKDSKPVTDHHIDQFSRYYVMRRFDVRNNDPEFEKLHKKYICLIKAFRTLNCLYWSSMAELPLLSDDEPWTNGGFDFRGVCRNFRKQYLQNKDEMLRLFSSLEHLD